MHKPESGKWSQKLTCNRLFSRENHFSLALTLYFILGLLLCALTSCKKSSEAKDAQARPDLAQQTFTLINQHRLLTQLSELGWQNPISAIAEKHSLSMAEGKTPFGHEGFPDRLKQLEVFFTFTAAGENVGYVSDQANPVETIVTGWLGKSEHRANMLGNFQLCGVGAAQGPGGEIYITQIFLRTSY